jgi:hypothetical protein
MYARIFTFVFRLVEETTHLFRKKNEGSFVSAVSSYSTRLYKANVKPEDDTTNTAAFARRLLHSSRGSLGGFIVDAPGFMYVIIDDDALSREDLVDTIRAMYDAILLNSATRHTPLVFLTRGIYQVMLASLHRESPFMFYQLLTEGTSPAADTLLIFCGNEERTQWNIQRDIYSALDDPLFTDLIKEAVTLLTVSWRLMVATAAINKEQFIYLFDRLLCLHLALEKNIIISQNIDFAWHTYVECFPDSRDELQYCVERYVSQASPVEFTERTYVFFKSVIDRMNALLRDKI